MGSPGEEQKKPKSSPAPPPTQRVSGVYPARDAYENPLDALSAHAVPQSASAAVEAPLELRAECLTAMGIALIKTDSAGFVRELNPVAEQLTGWTRSEALGKHVDVVFELGAGDSTFTGPLSLGVSAFPAATE